MTTGPLLAGPTTALTDEATLTAATESIFNNFIIFVAAKQNTDAGIFMRFLEVAIKGFKVELAVQDIRVEIYRLSVQKQQGIEVRGGKRAGQRRSRCGQPGDDILVRGR